MGITVSLNINELELSPWNPRFDPVENEAQAIMEMLESQHKKLVKLAEDIAKNGLNPSSILIVSDSDNFPGKKIVCEGNRRVAAIKLVLDPSLIIHGFAYEKAAFEALNERYSDSIPIEIPCYCTNDKNEISHLLKLRHTGQQDGVGTVQWGSIEVGRFNAHEHGETMQLGHQLLEFLRKNGVLESTVNKADLAVTNLTRLLSTPHVREKLGISRRGSDLEFSSIDINRTIKLIQDISRIDFKVREIYSASDRIAYIDDLFRNKEDGNSGWDSPKIDFEKNGEGNPESVDKSGTNQDAGESANASAKEKADREPIRRGAPTRRTRLIPQGSSIAVTDPRVKRIFDELRSLDVNDYTNAAAVLLRTFIELSCDCYLSKLKQNYNDGISLSKKIKNVSEELQYLGLIDAGCLQAMSNIRSECKDDGCLNVATLHAFVHSRSYNPNPDALIVAWDNIEPFERALWNRVHDGN